MREIDALNATVAARAAARAAANDSANDAAAKAANAAVNAARAAAKAADAANSYASYDASAAANAANDAVDAASYTADAHTVYGDAVDADAAHGDAVNANAVYGDAVNVDAAHADAASTDYKNLKSVGKSISAEDFAIDPSEHGPLGPLWPDGEPEWYQKALTQWKHALEEVGLDLPWNDISAVPSDLANEETQGLEVTFHIPPGVSDADAIKLIRDAVAKMNALHHELGGHGMEIDGLEIFETEPAEVLS